MRPRSRSIASSASRRSIRITIAGRPDNANSEMNVPTPLSIEVGRALTERRWVLVTAESCTGGLVAGAITDVSGSSGWFERGFVTYSNEAKVELLGVSPETLARFGAVSDATVREMAAGALARTRADIVVAIT